jgi:hypothetical protein
LCAEMSGKLQFVVAESKEKSSRKAATNFEVCRTIVKLF